MAARRKNKIVVLPEPVPDDGGDLARKARREEVKRRVDERSPALLLTSYKLKEIAADLDARRRPNLHEVTPERLENELRNIYAFATEFIEASLDPKSARTRELPADDEEAEAPHSRYRNIGIVGAAERRDAQDRLHQAQGALEKIERLLRSPEIARFSEFRPKGARILQWEIGRIGKLLREGWGTRRGLPALADTVRELHKVVYVLTGSWQRGDRTKDDEDEFLTGLMFDLTRPLVPESILDSDIRGVIKTAIRRPHNL